MSAPNIQGLGVVQDGCTQCGKATGGVEGLSWLEASGAPLVEATEALPAGAAEMVMKKSAEEDS